jgi:hypothetical protein
MNDFLCKYKFQLSIVFIGICVLEIFAFYLQLGEQTLIYPDCSNYLESANNLFIKHTGHYYRPILMAFITGLPYLFGSSEAAILDWSFFVNVFCWLGTSILVFEILKKILKEQIAFVLAFTTFLIFGSLVLNFHVLTENIYVFCIMLSFYLLMKYHSTNQFLFLSLAISLLLLSMLIKPGSKFLAIIFVLYYLRDIFKNYSAKSAIFIYGSIVLIVVQVVGMRVQFGDFTISYIDGVTYHNYLFSKAECLKNGKEYSQLNNPRAEYLFSLDFTDQKKVAYNDAVHQVKTNLPNVFKAYFSNLVENAKTGNACIEDLKDYYSSSNFETLKLTFYNVTKWQNRILTLLSVLIAFYYLRKKEKLYRGIAFFIVYIIFLSGISSGQGDRFHLVVFPFTFLLLGKYISEKRTIPFFEPLQR